MNYPTNHEPRRGRLCTLTKYVSNEGMKSGSELCVDDKAKGGLVLAGNPVSGAGNQVEIGAAVVAEDELQGRGLWRIGGYLEHAEVQRLSLCVDDHHVVANMEIAQVPEDGWTTTRTIKMPIDDGTPLIARARSQIVPAGIIPRMACRCAKITISQDADLFNEGIHLNSRN